MEESNKDLIAAAYDFHSLSLMQKMANKLGKESLAEHYQIEAVKVQQAFVDEWYDPKAGYFGQGTQTEQVLPLAFDLCSDVEMEQTVASALVRNIQEKDTHLQTGFLGTSQILQVLSQHGYHDLAWQLVRNESFPSWGYMRNQGATSLWERWDCDRVGPLTNSRNHYALGTYVQWFFRDVLALTPDQHQKGHWHFQPHFAYSPEKIQITGIPTGVSDIRWQKSPGSVSLAFTVRPDAFVSFHLPETAFWVGGQDEMAPFRVEKGHYHLPAGHYRCQLQFQ
ncbi:MAG: hypothetical protein AAF206_31140 [Bacteroidota bacterium]